jgi:hypothetical protein
MNLTEISLAEPEITSSSQRLFSTVTFFGTIFIAIPGLCLNVINLIIFRKGHFNKGMKFFYTAQSTADFISLAFFIPAFFPISFNKDWSTYSSLLCKFSWFMRRYLGTITSWFQVLTTFDRAVSIICSTYYKRLLSRRNMWTMVISTIVLLFIGNSSNFLYYQTIAINNASNSSQVIFAYACTVSDIQSYYVNISTIVIRSIAPFGVMFTLNILLTCSLRRKRKKVNKTKNREFNFAFAVISTNYIFLLLNTPLTVFQIYDIMFHFLDYEHLFILRFYQTSAAILVYFYQAYNFILYFTFNKLFRQEFFTLILRRNNNKNINIYNNNNKNKSIHLSRQTSNNKI